MTPLRGEVYWLDFDPAIGAEMRAMHPCVIVSNNVGNRVGSLVIVVAVTSNLRAASLGSFIPGGHRWTAEGQRGTLRPRLHRGQGEIELEDRGIARCLHAIDRAGAPHIFDTVNARK